MARAKNGTGKTGAFLIPLLQKIDMEDKTLGHPQGQSLSLSGFFMKFSFRMVLIFFPFTISALVIVPTREVKSFLPDAFYGVLLQHVCVQFFPPSLCSSRSKPRPSVWLLGNT